MTDAHVVLDVAAGASDEQIRAAYVKKVKEYPPDRAPEEFERIRDAYETLRDPRRRVRQLLLSADPEATFSSVFANQRPKRVFVGPDPWLALLRGK